ncbi:hypothetical protein RhiirC2_714774 [Rhizophagus irregularis]|uniref:Uncharacterized protein n=1 Tax=Rhizophagus irregularis TaxID=588596 RepID=A0A2N1MY19_9GLOM|nr:hypothetical protein RhiirC2_714774 [Rhizophagus irregularis]
MLGCFIVDTNIAQNFGAVELKEDFDTNEEYFGTNPTAKHIHFIVYPYRPPPLMIEEIENDRAISEKKDDRKKGYFIYQQLNKGKSHTIHISQKNMDVIKYPWGLGGEFPINSFYITDSVIPSLCTTKFTFLVTAPKNDLWHEFAKHCVWKYYALIWTDWEIWNVWEWDKRDYKHKIPKEQTGGGPLAGKLFELLAHDILQKGGKFKFCKIDEISLECYNISDSPNFKSIDSIAPDCDGTHYLYQMTIADKHSIKKYVTTADTEYIGWDYTTSWIKQNLTQYGHSPHMFLRSICQIFNYWK